MRDSIWNSSIKSHPLVFNESFFEHGHCILAAGLGLQNYADEHGGQIPAHPNGYGDALLLLGDDLYYCFTGPGYSTKAFEEAQRTGRDLPESECGRVYVQGLTNKTKGLSNIVLLFDKLPTPGGDHCHFANRCFAPLGREVLFGNGTRRFIEEAHWPAFAREQIELLVGAGIPRKEARRLYAEPPLTPRPQ
jgi:hypothetical protein